MKTEKETINEARTLRIQNRITKRPKWKQQLIDKVIAENQDKVDEYRNGKDKLFGFFVGQTMKLSGGQANPGMVNQLLKDKLK